MARKRTSTANTTSVCSGRSNSRLQAADKFENPFLEKPQVIDLPPDEIERLREMLDEVYPDDEDEDEAHPLSDVMLRYWGRKPNARDCMMQLIDKIRKEKETTDDDVEVCKKLGLEPPPTIKHELASAMLREMFNMREKPRSFMQTLVDAIGLSKLIQYVRGKKETEVKSKWPFGIELKDPNMEITPLSENALRGYMGLPYYDHVADLAKRNPENARRILTIVHRIYKPPILFIDLHPEREHTDQDLYMDSENLKRAQGEAYKHFVNTYPDLKWPVDDQGFLDIYNAWYPEDKAVPADSLPELMREEYGPGMNLIPPNFYYRFIGVPAISCAAGAAFGGLLSQAILGAAGVVGGISAQNMVHGIVGPKVCSVALAGAALAGLSRDMTVKGDLFNVALKNLVDNAFENPQSVISAAYSGLIPKDDVVRGLEKFTIHCTLTAFSRAMRLAREGKGIKTWNLLAKQLGRVAEICLPICGASVYRVVYSAACDLAASSDLPYAYGGEVLGREISGDPEFSDDDYTHLHEEGYKELGIPMPDVAKFERTAMLFTTFVLQAFGSIQNFKRKSDEEIDKYKEFVRAIKELDVSDDAWDNLKDQPMAPSTLDDLEKFARELDQIGGKFKRITLQREYGVDTHDEFIGESDEEKHIRMQIELQEARDAVTDLAHKVGYKLEMLKALSIALHVREEWLLPKYTQFLKQQCVEFIAAEIRNKTGNLEKMIQGFHIAKKHNEEIKNDAMFYLAQQLHEANALNHDEVLEMARVANISEQVALDACSVALFQNLRDELATWDLTAVTPDQIREIMQRYRCRDLVFVNAICEVIKKTAAEAKKEMINARNKLNWNLVEKYMTVLLRGRNAVVNAAADTIDCKLWYRLERAFRNNLQYIDPNLDRYRILGTGKVAKIENADWEMLDPPPKKSEWKQLVEDWEADLKNVEPLKITGEDNLTPIPLQMELSRMVEKGELDPRLECIPNEFHVGERPKQWEYEPDFKYPEDPYALQRPIIDSRLAYACWVVYCYRKRAVKEEDVKTVLTIFPFLEKLVEKSDVHWRRLYARQRLRQKDSLGSNVDWCKELDCDEEMAQNVCAIAYEEDLLKRTGAYVEHIEDDIGDVEDRYFNPFDPSVYNRITYLYSSNVPSELELENIKKIQAFFKLTPQKIEEIHTKCFSHALDLHCGAVMKRSPQDWPKAVEEELKPLAKELLIQETPFNMILRKTEYDYLIVEANKLMMKRTPGRQFLDMCEFIINEFKRLGVMYMVDGKRRMRFTIRAQNNAIMEEIIGAFIISLVDVYGTVDQEKLNEQCAIYGLIKDQRKEVLNRLGRKFYHHFLQKFSDEELCLESLNEVEHLHKAYELGPKDVEEIYKTHVGIRIREWYDPESGLDAMKKLVTILRGQDFNKFIPFERSRRIHWFINIINDCINLGQEKAETRIFTYTIEDFFALHFEGGEENFDTLQGIVNLSIRILSLTPEELREARIIVGEEIGATALDNVRQRLLTRDGIYAADGEMSKFIRALSMAPHDALQIVKKELPHIKNPEELRKVIMLLPCADEALAKSIRLIDELMPVS
ncbi:ABC transporter, putative [Babesia ovata]|uniref:ABC transporter, putative n=1 Tax=Babesia ovata TaxID=189622 RepID=A0A2H6K895_9APIC|nr:ABC transporter, putative [Babesia ovata]GBE59216.1 ABC transporter, putative [Babesia ovata]